MKLKTFSIPYLTDERLKYTKEYLENLGYVYLENCNEADFAVLPIPAKKYMFDNLNNKYIFYGAGDFRGFDYNKVNSFLLENAYLTAEGAVALLKENSDYSVYGSKILITGYGRIAQALQKMLTSMGADVTICSRSEQSKAQAKFAGVNHMSFDDLKSKNDFDVVFNTVPHLIFTKSELDSLNESVILIDLASFPGGVDTLYAKSKNINLIDGRRLPSRYSQITAGELIGKAVHQIIREELS